MGRIVSNFFISMDGVVERPDLWHFPYFDDEMGEVVEVGEVPQVGPLHDAVHRDEEVRDDPAHGERSCRSVVSET